MVVYLLFKIGRVRSFVVIILCDVSLHYIKVRVLLCRLGKMKNYLHNTVCKIKYDKEVNKFCILLCEVCHR